MANITTINPWVLDTASATPVATGTVRISGIRWVGATTAGHSIVITDVDGNVVWASVAGGGNYVEADKPLFKTMNGFVLLTMQSGKVYIELTV